MGGTTRIMTAGMLENNNNIPSLASKHAYAILNIEQHIGSNKYEVVIWNPWGTDFTPKGNDSELNGYKQTHGVFKMDLNEFCNNFSYIAFERSNNM